MEDEEDIERIGESLYKITFGTGFQVTLNNGYMISVQFGPCTYSSNRDLNFEAKKIVTTASLAEIAVFDEHGDFIKSPTCPEYESVEGWCSTKRFIEILNWANSQKGNR